jgi:hypothetical protein
MAVIVGSSRTVADSALYAKNVSLGPPADDHIVGKRTYLPGLNGTAAADDEAVAVAVAAVAAADSSDSHSGSSPETVASKCSGCLNTAWLLSVHCSLELLKRDLAHPQVCYLVE